MPKMVANTNAQAYEKQKLTQFKSLFDKNSIDKLTYLNGY